MHIFESYKLNRLIPTDKSYPQCSRRLEMRRPCATTTHRASASGSAYTLTVRWLLAVPRSRRISWRRPVSYSSPRTSATTTSSTKSVQQRDRTRSCRTFIWPRRRNFTTSKSACRLATRMMSSHSTRPKRPSASSGSTTKVRFSPSSYTH